MAYTIPLHLLESRNAWCSSNVVICRCPRIEYFHANLGEPLAESMPMISEPPLFSRRDRPHRPCNSPANKPLQALAASSSSTSGAISAPPGPVPGSFWSELQAGRAHSMRLRIQGEPWPEIKQPINGHDATTYSLPQLPLRRGARSRRGQKPPKHCLQIHLPGSWRALRSTGMSLNAILSALLKPLQIPCTPVEMQHISR